MKRVATLAGLWVVLAALACACGPSPAYEAESPEAEHAQVPPPAARTPPPPPPGAAPPGSVPADPSLMHDSDGAAQPDVAPDAAPPPADQWTASHPTGQWVYANGYGWMWIPNESRVIVVEETPYVYLYTPSYGWTWYVSPWGPGPYRYGVWVVHPWRPVGWRHGWVARPGVVVHIHGRTHVVRGAPRGGRGRRH